MISGELLKFGVDHVYKTALTKSPLDILTHIRIQAGRNIGLTVSACDCDVETKINFLGNFDELDVAIPATKLRSALTMMSGDLKIKVGTVVSISSGKGSVRLPYLAGKSMPSITIPDDIIATLPCKKIFDAMKSVAWLCKPSIRVIFSCVQMACDGKRLVVFASDGIALAAYDFEVICDPFAFLIRAETLAKISEYEEIQILENFIRFSSERRSTVVKLSDGKPIDFMKLEKPAVGEISFPREQMQSIVAGVGHLYDLTKESKLSKWVAISNKEKMEVSANHNGLGGDFSVDGEGCHIECAFQVLALQNVLSRISSDSVTMQWCAGFPDKGSSPAMFKDGNFRAFIAPIRI